MASNSNDNIITSPQTITANWVDVGGEIDTLGRTFFGAYIELDINDSKNVQFRYRALYETGGLEYNIPFKTIKNNKTLLDDFPEEINSDTDQNIIVEAILDKIVPIIKLQVRATLSGTDGIITTAKYWQSTNN